MSYSSSQSKPLEYAHDQAETSQEELYLSLERRSDVGGLFHLVMGADIDAVAAAPKQDVWCLLSLLFLPELTHMPKGMLLELIFRGDSSCSFSNCFSVFI